MSEGNNSSDLLKKFQRLRALADAYIRDQEAGFYPIEILLGFLDQLRVTDASGTEWKIGYPPDTWYKLENDDWVSSFPPFSQYLLTDPNEYVPKQPHVDLMWKLKLRTSSENDE